MKQLEGVLAVNQLKHIGGGQVFVNELVRELNQFGCRVTYWNGGRTKELLANIFSKKTKFIVWNYYSKFPGISIVLSYFLKKQNIIVVHGIWVYEFCSSVQKKYSTKNDIKNHYIAMRLWMEQFLYCLVATKLVFVSRYDRSLFYSTPLFFLFKGKKQSISYCGVNRKIYFPVNAFRRNELRRKIGIFNDDIVLLMIGRIEARKNYLDAVKILYDLYKSNINQNIFLYFVFSHGNSNDIEYLQRLFKIIHTYDLSMHIRVVSGVPVGGNAIYYQIADAYLMLSKEQETFGLVTLEALSCGCPVFGYDSCATPEIIQDNKRRYLFTTGDTHSVASGIRKYLHYSEFQKRLLRDEALKRSLLFSWQATAEKVLGYRVSHLDRLHE